MKKKKSVLFKILIALLLILLVAGGTALHNPRIKLFLSTVWFSAFTLNDPEYIFYHVDLMELCQRYLNDDTSISGTLLLDHVKDVGFSMHLDVDADRCYSQKKLSGKAALSVLSLDIGDFYGYAENEMVYFVAPSLDDLSYAFDTEMNLFFQAPQLSSDISAQWFSDHMDDIRTLTTQIKIRDTHHVIDDGGLFGKCRGYQVTIPRGCGGFIWELLGMDAPDKDISFEMYLTPFGRARRIYMDLTEEMADSTIVSADLTIDEKNCSTIDMNVGLVDDETLLIHATRNGEYAFTNYVDTQAFYYAQTGDVFEVTGFLTWNPAENGVTLTANDYVLKQNEEIIAEGYFDGTIEKTKIHEDVFAHTPVDLYEIDIIEWRELKRDMDGFIKDVEAEVKNRLF